ncbi:MAG: hypothetical protein SFX18_10550 [Pirellulales bacterium]|nr:hypothetical protein [Pirellulales bacterium]
MAQIEHLNDHPDDSNRGLYLLDCSAFTDILPAVSQLPGKHFVTLMVADFSTVTQEHMVALSQQLIAAGSRYFCAWGRDCQMAHLAFDLACCEYEADNEQVIITTDHSNESIEDAIWFALVCAYPVDPYDKEWHATIAICVNNQSASHIVRKAFTDPLKFSEKNGSVVDEET